MNRTGLIQVMLIRISCGFWHNSVMEHMRPWESFHWGKLHLFITTSKQYFVDCQELASPLSLSNRVCGPCLGVIYRMKPLRAFQWRSRLAWTLCKTTGVQQTMGGEHYLKLWWRCLLHSPPAFSLICSCFLVVTLFPVQCCHPQLYR